MAYRPPSRHGKADRLYDELQEGIPDYMLRPVLTWIVGQVEGRQGWRGQIMEALQLGVRHMPPLDWSAAYGTSAARSLQERVIDDRDLGLDILDWLVGTTATDSQAGDLHRILTLGGSAWEITRTEDRRFMLTHRAIGPVVQAIEHIQPVSDRAHKHLLSAWTKLMGRNPDPSASYRESVRAVEAAAKPVVLPDDELATLGKMIRAIEDKPEKWAYVLGGTTPEDVARMAASIWTGQLDRHGTDDESEPLHVSQEQADAAFHVALALTRIFAGRLIDTA